MKTISSPVPQRTRNIRGSIPLACLLVALSSCLACIPDVTIQSDEDGADAGEMTADDDDSSIDAEPSANSDDDDDTPPDDDTTADDDAPDGGADDDPADNPADDDEPDDHTATGDAGAQRSDDELDNTLGALNVDTTETPRVDGDGEPLPDSYTPLRTKKTLRQKSELFVTGLGLEADDDRVNLLKFSRVETNGSGVFEKLPDEPLPGDFESSNVHTTAAGDVDGDGFDEMVLFWWDEVEGDLHLQTVDDADGDFVASDVSTLGSATPSQLRLGVADFFGTGVDSIVAAVVEEETVSVTLLEGDAEQGYSRLGGASVEFQATGAGTLGIELAAGQIDRDAASELVVVINETFGGGRNGSPGSGLSTYAILDDATTDLAELATDVVSARIDNESVDGLTSTVALGDVDGDSLDEIVLAGLADSFPVDCEPISAMHVVLDDAAFDFAELGAARSSVSVSPGCESSGNNGWTAHLWAGTLNVDVDEAREIHVNGKVFDDFATTAPWTPMELDGVPFEIPGDELFRGTNNGRPQIGRDNAALVVGDVTDDGFDDIAVYTPTRQSLGDDTLVTHHLRVWGFDPELGTWALKHFESLAGGPPANYPPTDGPVSLVALNVDADSTVVRYTGTHRVVFTEPIVHAALAAPPCWDDGTQATDSCRTSWGQGASAGADASVSHEVSARKHMGWNGGVDIPFVGEVGVEFEETVGVSLTNEASLGYELTSTITYQTGAMEDTVVATVVPYDQYIYTLVSHSEFPELVGEEIIVSLPRRPRTIQIERQFYNEAIAGSGTPIGENVFGHTIGDPTTYPSESQARNETSLRVGPVEVGASTGNTDVELSETVTAGFRSAVTVSYEATLKATSGVNMAGFSVGESLTASLGITVGETTTFSGSVGDIQPEEFTPDKAYGYGMFVYLEDQAGQDRPFQVINYWVE